MTPLDQWLAETQTRCDAATEGPWRYDRAGLWPWCAGGQYMATWEGAATQADWDFVHASRTDLPRALEIIRTLKAALEWYTTHSDCLDGHEAHVARAALQLEMKP